MNLHIAQNLDSKGNFLRGIFLPQVIFYGSYISTRGSGRNNDMIMAPGKNSRRVASRHPRMPIVNTNIVITKDPPSTHLKI